MLPVRHDALPSPAVETLTSQESFAEPSLVARWNELLAAGASIDKTWQSPTWFAHARENPGDARGPLPAALVVARDGRGTVEALAPVVKDRDELDFIVGSRTLAQVKLKSALVLGSQFLGREDAATAEALLGGIDRWAADCDCITFRSLPLGCFTRRFVESARLVAERFVVYAPIDQGTGKIYVADFPGSFDAYNAALDKKRRDNFKRKVRVLDKQGKPGKLRRFESPDEVAEFLSLARAIAGKSWQRGIGVDPFPREVDWQAKLSDQARRGILRGYILHCGDEPAAFGVGVLVDGVFHYRATGYDASLSSLSPGTVLTYLMFGDLMSGPSPMRRMSFGYGDTPYKRLFCNGDYEATRLLLLRKTAANRALKLGHQAFRAGVERGKELYRRWRPPAEEGKKKDEAPSGEA